MPKQLNARSGRTLHYGEEASIGGVTLFRSGLVNRS